MGLSMLQAVEEEADHSEMVSQLKGELRDAQDDLELNEALLKSSKEKISLLDNQLGAFKEEIAKKDRILAERDGLLSKGIFSNLGMGIFSSKEVQTPEGYPSSHH